MCASDVKKWTVLKYKLEFWPPGACSIAWDITDLWCTENWKIIVPLLSVIFICLDKCSSLSPICTNSGASDFCHVWLILPGSLTDFEIGIFLSLSDFVQCDVCQSEAYKNWTDGLAKSVRQQKSDQFWLFHVNDPLLWSPYIKNQ